MPVKPRFKDHVSLMFRQIDTTHMSFKFDLSNYDDVKNHSAIILKSLKAEDGVPLMPPESSGGPWPAEWIALFERWIAEGHAR